MTRVLFLVDNIPLELDSRVRREARTLLNAGAAVAVICPGEPGQPWHEVVDGVQVYRYQKPSLARGLLGHLAEYATTIAAQLPLSLVVLLRHGFDVVHIANPPDLLWLVAAPYKALGKRMVFDQHDLVPELFEVRYGDRFSSLITLVRAAERMNYRLADHVIATNDTFRSIAIGRGGIAPEAVTIVRNGPDLEVDFHALDPDPAIRRLGEVVVGYLGIMNEQDHF
jgi:glycosyltransferase involved in cell wall biosynthesis